MSEQKQPVHPLGNRARVLLTSVFGPYARDDEYGSRKINPMELYQNQVTRVQGGFSLRMFHRSFGLMMIRDNLDAPCTLLDFPTREGFAAEITKNSYDIIGIGAILPNIGKVREMCKLIRRHQPNATIIVGGHISNKEGLHKLIDADHIVRGEGIRWFQRYLGQDDRTARKAPPGDLGVRRENDGNQAREPSRRHGGDPDSVGRLPDGLQLLLHLCAVRREGKIRQFLRNRR